MLKNLFGPAKTDSNHGRKRPWSDLNQYADAKQCKDQAVPKKRFGRSSKIGSKAPIPVTVSSSSLHSEAPNNLVSALESPMLEERKEMFLSPDNIQSTSNQGYSNTLPKNTQRKESLEFTAKLLSRSLSRLSLASAPALAQQLYDRASDSIASLIRIRHSKKRRFNGTKLEEKNTPATSLSSLNRTFERIGRSSLRKSVWPVPWLEAVFLPEFPNKSNITEKDFSILNCIGTGSFGKVYRVCLKHQLGMLFAMKKQQKSDVLTRNAIQQVKDEASIHKSLSSSVFITKCYASWQSRTHLFTVLQYAMGYGDLFTLWRDYGPFAEDTLRIYAAEIAFAIDYIHRNNIVYRDLKLENVVLDLDGHIQIVDFGFSKRLADGERTRTICGTLQYMAPEIAREAFYGKEVDWWSYGVLLYILNTNRYPFPNCDITSHNELRYDGYSTPCCESALGDLFNKLLSVNIENRIQTFVQVKSHSFFDSINWDDVAHKKLEPFAYIEKLRRCPSCNSLYDKSVSDLSGTDVEENWAAFEERYEFNNDDFHDRL